MKGCTVSPGPYWGGVRVTEQGELLKSHLGLCPMIDHEPHWPPPQPPDEITALEIHVVWFIPKVGPFDGYNLPPDMKQGYFLNPLLWIGRQ